ncbi:MAG: hypothetical protein II086_10370, partial [Ruminococcus sp.]|nr:hypothetical protein [Ruminococcus sp.]
RSVMIIQDLEKTALRKITENCVSFGSFYDVSILREPLPLHGSFIAARIATRISHTENGLPMRFCTVYTDNTRFSHKYNIYIQMPFVTEIGFANSH